MAEKKKRPSGPSGAHRSPRRILSESRKGQFNDWDEAAANEGLSWTEWARDTMDRAAGTKSRAKKKTDEK